MFRFIKKIFIRLLTSIYNASNHTKCVCLSNQKYNTQPIIINLHPNEYTQGLPYYVFAVNLDNCVGRCDTRNDLFNKVCLLNTTEDLNLSIFNMITEINESETLTKHISYKCKRKFDAKKLNSSQNQNDNKCRCVCKYPKERCVCDKDYIWNPVTCSCKNDYYLASIIDDSVIT